MNEDIKRELKDAYDIALKTLRGRYQEYGIFAGKSHFSDVWARDSFYASLGALVVQDHEIVKRNLESHFTFLADDGQVPLRIGQKHMLLKFMGIDAKVPQARFIDDKGFSRPTDSNSLCMILAEKYLNQSHDLTFISYYFDHLKKIIDWNFAKEQDPDQDGLIEQGPYACWMDSLKKRGKVMYTNVLHFQATNAFVSLCKHLKKDKEAAIYQEKAVLIKDRINQVFWNGDFFTDFVDNSEKRYFSSDGNLFAILFSLASNEQTEKIYKWLDKVYIKRDFCVKTNYPNYENKHIYFPFFLLNMNDYHNGLRWLWIGCLSAAVRQAVGQTEAAINELRKIAKKITEFNGVYEVYLNGNPLKRFWYQSEQEFAWSSGLFVWACHQSGYTNV